MLVRYKGTLLICLPHQSHRLKQWCMKWNMIQLIGGRVLLTARAVVDEGL